jgi:hypothetical protein
LTITSDTAGSRKNGMIGPRKYSTLAAKIVSRDMGFNGEEGKLRVAGCELWVASSG